MNRTVLPYTRDDFTLVSEANVWVCNNCGAAGHHTDYIKHYGKCKAGEAKWWATHPEMYDNGEKDGR